MTFSAVPSRLLRLLGAVLAAVCVTTTATAVHASTTSGPTRAALSLHLLVLDDGGSGVRSLLRRISRQGIPHTTIDLTNTGRTPLTAARLAFTTGGVTTGHYHGMVLPGESPQGLSAAERSVLDAYSAAFHVRQVLAYTYAHPGVGLRPPSDGGFGGSLDGVPTQLTAEAAAGPFSYLARGPQFDDFSATSSEAYGYLSKPDAAAPGEFTPYLTAPIPGRAGATGTLVGVHALGGVERMVLTYSTHATHRASTVLAPGILRWLTRDLAPSHSRNYLSVHVDDVFLPSALWKPADKCTTGLDCAPVKYPLNAPGNTAVMQAVDATHLAQWQRNHHNFKIDLAFNGYGATRRGKPFADAVLPIEDEFRWISHTWSHLFLSCRRNWDTTPWSCYTKGDQPEWVSRATVDAELGRNIELGSSTPGFTHFAAGELITGEHSGLRSLPQLQGDNPHLVAALKEHGVRWVATDASREKHSRRLGGARTLPRYPMSIYFNTTTKRQAADEYTWINSSEADGGSGDCTRLGQVCQPPLNLQTGFDDVVVPTEAKETLDRVLNNDPRPHYAHQNNLTQDRLLLPVLDRIVDEYNELFNASAPLVNPTMTEAGEALTKMQDWRSARSHVDFTVQGQFAYVNSRSEQPVQAPLTVPASGVTDWSSWQPDAYGGNLSGFMPLDAGASATVPLSAPTGFAIEVTWNPLDVTSTAAVEDPRQVTPSSQLPEPAAPLRGERAQPRRAAPAPAGAGTVATPSAQPHQGELSEPSLGVVNRLSSASAIQRGICGPHPMM